MPVQSFSGMADQVSQVKISDASQPSDSYTYVTVSRGLGCVRPTKREETMFSEFDNFQSSSAAIRTEVTSLLNSAAQEASLSSSASTVSPPPPSPRPDLEAALTSLDRLKVRHKAGG